MGSEGVVARLPEVGELLAGKYRVTRLIGEGGMGVVLEAEHLRLRQALAIKFLNPTMVGVEEIVKRFDREARAAATLRSRHVVRVSDVEATPEGLPYIVMELLEGRDLESERERRGPLPYADVVDWVLQACGALAEAHDAGIVHRDLKPSNLFLARESQEVTVLKVLDFGISKFLSEEESKLTSAGSIVGTILYMSPEQIRGKAIDGRSDIWSLGVILYELLTGDTPWTGNATKVSAEIVTEPPPDIRQKVALPEDLAATIHLMLAKPANERIQTVADVAARLAPFAPQGSIGSEVAHALARRSARSLPIVTNPSPSSRTQDATDISDARTVLQSPERSTISATTSAAGIPVRQRAVGFIALAAVLTIGAIIATLVITTRKTEPTKDPVVATSVTVPPSVNVAPVVSSAAMSEPAPPPTMAESAAPDPKTKPAPVRSAPPAQSIRRPAATTAAPPPPPTKPTATEQPTNPLFIK